MSNIKCEIECKNDFLTGTYLIARLPDEDVDENALLTIQGDCPDFILPFSYKRINGQTEFTYKVGTYSKLQYFYGSVTHEQYVGLWSQLIRPLLECGDWFMSPGSFILSADYLYYDKNKDAAAYIYVPSKSGYSEQDAFSNMITEVAKSIKIADPILENKVLRSVINDFNPVEFLSMLMEYEHQNEPAQPPAAPDTTHETKAIVTETGLRCIGHARFPQHIAVDITDDQIFTIGRYDTKIGKKQSSFEFEDKTKAISRRHAVIERSGSAYTIVDLASSAGTFVNDKKIPPNTPTPLEQGCRVSFGNLGADYVWEAS